MSADAMTPGRCHSGYSRPGGIWSGRWLPVVFVVPIVIVFFVLARSGSRDFQAYVEYFQCLPTDSCGVVWEVEPTARLIAGLVEPMFGAEAVVFLYVFIAYFTKAIAFSRVTNTVVVWIAYTLSFSILLEVTQIRAAVAIGFCVISIQIYVEKRAVLAFLLAGVGVLFHYSAVVVFALLLPTSLLAVILPAIFLSAEPAVNWLFSELSSSPDIVATLRLNSLAAYLLDQDCPSIFNSKNLLAIVATIPVVMRWAPQGVSVIWDRLALCAWVSVLGIYFVSSQLFSRLSDFFLVLLVVFVAAYVTRHAMYIIMLLVVSGLVGVASLDILN